MQWTSDTAGKFIKVKVFSGDVKLGGGEKEKRESE